MTQSPQIVIPPGMGVLGKSMWESVYWRAKAAAHNYAGGSNSWERGSRRSFTSTPQLHTWWEPLPIWRQGCLSLIHTVCMFQHWPSRSAWSAAPAFSISSLQHASALLNYTANNNCLECKRTFAGKKLVIISSKQGRKSRAIAKSFSPVYFLTATSHSLLSQNAVYSPPTSSKHLPASYEIHMLFY